MAFTVTTLMENNSANPQFRTEHGLSLYLTDGSFSLLLDTGASSAFLENANKLNVDLKNLDILVLSHGHYDHTGGVKPLLESGCLPLKTYFGQNFFAHRYHREPGRLRPISARVSEEYLFDKRLAFFVLEPGMLQINDKIYLLCGIPSKNEIEKSNSNLICKHGQDYIVDDFNEETIVVVRGDHGLAVLSGCSHKGVINTCMWASEVFKEPVRTFIGGTHLVDADEERMRITMERLKDIGVQRLGACHCNGEKANEMFSREFEGFFSNNVGTVVEL